MAGDTIASIVPTEEGTTAATGAITRTCGLTIAGTILAAMPTDTTAIVTAIITIIVTAIITIIMTAIITITTTTDTITITDTDTDTNPH